VARYRPGSSTTTSPASSSSRIKGAPSSGTPIITRAPPATGPAARPHPFTPPGDDAGHEPTLPPHTLLHSVFLHLAPGLLSLLCYVLLAPVVMRWG